MRDQGSLVSETSREPEIPLELKKLTELSKTVLGEVEQLRQRLQSVLSKHDHKNPDPQNAKLNVPAATEIGAGIVEVNSILTTTYVLLCQIRLGLEV